MDSSSRGQPPGGSGVTREPLCGREERGVTGQRLCPSVGDTLIRCPADEIQRGQSRVATSGAAGGKDMIGAGDIVAEDHG